MGGPPCKPDAIGLWAVPSDQCARAEAAPPGLAPQVKSCQKRTRGSGQPAWVPWHSNVTRPGEEAAAPPLHQERTWKTTVLGSSQCSFHSSLATPNLNAQNPSLRACARAKVVRGKFLDLDVPLSRGCPHEEWSGSHPMRFKAAWLGRSDRDLILTGCSIGTSTLHTKKLSRSHNQRTSCLFKY